MTSKSNLIICLLILISVSVSFGQQKNRPKGPREYKEDYPETRGLPLTTGVPIVDTLDIKDPQFGTLDIKPVVNRTSNHTKNIKLTTNLSALEHPECAKCLNDKYLKHYYAKGCKPVEGEVICKKPCPKYFDCPKKLLKTSPTGCQYKGRLYKISEKVPVDNPCRVNCFCDQNNDNLNVSNPKIVCADVECFGDFSLPPENCYKSYEFGKCCSSRQECPTDEELADMKKCLYDGKEYRLGERIYPRDDPCIECICGEDWNQRSPLNSTACRKISCDLELDAKSREGCIPIYSEKTCCPSEYHCPPPKEMHCSFDGQQYRIGQKLDTDNDQIECTCRMPPDFTCIRKRERVQAFQLSTPSKPTTPIRPSELLRPAPVEITSNRTRPSGLLRPAPEETSSNRTRPSQPIRPSELTRPVKDKVASEFLRPAQQTREKPQKCPPFIEGGLSCAGFNCTTIIDANGCQACSCERPCPQLDCNDPCYLYAVTPGECPKCKCP